MGIALLGKEGKASKVATSQGGGYGNLSLMAFSIPKGNLTNGASNAFLCVHRNKQNRVPSILSNEYKK